jgi:hypothetical protein
MRLTGGLGAAALAAGLALAALAHTPYWVTGIDDD